MGYKNDLNPAIFEAIHKLDIISFLEEYSISYSLQGKNIGINYIGVSPCPNCQETHFHYGINKLSKSSSCFKCGCYYSPLKTLSILSKQSVSKIINILVDYNFNDNDDIITKIKYTLKNKWTPPVNNQQVIDLLPKGASPINEITRKMKLLFYNKHIRKEHIQKYNLHFVNTNLFKNYILWPIYFKDKIVSWQMRSIESKKYHSSKTISKYIYNYDNATNINTVILVEGFFDLLRLETFIDKKKLKNIAVISGLLKKLSKQQIQHLINLNPKRFIILFDRDSWFDYYKVQEKVNFNVEFEILPQGKDPNMLTWGELNQLFENILQK